MFEKVKDLSKNKKIVITVVAMLALGGIGGTVYASQSKKQLSEAQETVDNEQNNLKNVKSKLEKLLDPIDKEFLFANVTMKQVKPLTEEFDQATKKVLTLPIDSDKLYTKEYSKEESGVKDLIETIENKVSSQEGVNKLFTSKDKKVALNGTKIVKDLPISDDLKMDSIQSVRKAYLQDKKETSFTKTISDLVNSAENQLKQIEKATTAVSKVYKDKKVVSTDSKLYDAAKAETEKIKNEKAKKNLLDQLEKVKADIDKKAKEEAEKNASDQASQQVQAQTQQNTQTAVESTVQQGASEQNIETQAPAPTYDGGNGGYVAPPATGGNDGGNYQPPVTNGGSGSGANTTQPPATGGNGQGVMTQDEMNKAAEEASQMDPTKDPNSPWYNK